MSAFTPQLIEETSPTRGTYYTIEGLPAKLMVGPFRAQSQLSYVRLAVAGVKYVVSGSPPHADEFDLEKCGIKWLADNYSLHFQQLIDYLEERNTPLPVGARCRPLPFQYIEHDFDSLMCNAHRAGCALLMGKGVLIYGETNVAHAAIFAGTVLVLLGCDHEQIADMLYPELWKLGLEEQTAAQLKPILAHVRHRSIENCRLIEKWGCTAR